MAIWFTADNHFGHTNIIEYSARPFKTVEQMDESMIERWNSVVAKDDIVYHLGDFTLGDVAVANAIWSRLNGVVSMLHTPWHHDKRWINEDYITASGCAVNLLPPMHVIEGRSIGTEWPIVLCHYPIEEWDRKHYGAVHLHGHSHGRSKYALNRYDVGVDHNDFIPVSLDTIKQLDRAVKRIYAEARGEYEKA